MIFEVEIVEHTQTIVEIEANDADEAEAIVRDRYANGVYDKEEPDDQSVSINAILANV